MRFNRRNWVKYFDGTNKKTTIRIRKSKLGHHKAYAGSYYHPELLGEFDIIKIVEIQYKDLTEQNAVDDGFKTLEELKAELQKLNGKIPDDRILYQNWTVDVKNNEHEHKLP